jgi:DNA replication protein DnaC
MACPLCDDSGWKVVGPEADRRVAPCDCRTAGAGERLLARARIPKRYEHCELSDFDILPGRYEAALQRAKRAAQHFVEHYPVEKDGLLLLGPIGVGKTHLAVGIIRELMRSKGVHCLFCDYRELLKEIQNSYNPSVQATEMEVLRPIVTAEVLVLDELGAVKPSDWVWDTVSLVLNARYNDRLTTIITTNLPDLPPRSGGQESEHASAARRASSEPTLGDRITERMRSRLNEMCRKVELQGEDFRQRIKSASFHSR